MIREPRKVESETEPRNFIKDKLCAIGLADVSVDRVRVGVSLSLCYSVPRM